MILSFQRYPYFFGKVALAYLALMVFGGLGILVTSELVLPVFVVGMLHPQDVHLRG